MHRAFVGDLHQPAALVGIEIAAQGDGAHDAVDHAFLGLAFRAIDGMDLGVAQADSDAFERQRLTLGIETQGHRGAGPERGEQEIIGSRAGVAAAGGDRLVGEEAMPADRDLLLEFALAGLAHDHLAGVVLVVRQHRRVAGHIEIALHPGVDHGGDVARVAAVAQQMVRARE